MAGGVPAAAPPAKKPITILDAIEEAYRRGLDVPADKAAIYDEAVKRGLVQDVRRTTMDRVTGDLKAFGEGAKNATVGLLNAPAAISRYARDKVGGAMGFEPEQLQAMDDMKSNWGIATPQPTEDVLKRVETITGKHEPINREERYFSAAGSGVPSILMGPGGWTQRIVSALSGGVGSEYGGEKMKSFGPGWELAGRLVGGVAGSSIPDILRRGLTPLPINQARRDNINVLNEAGVPTTAGQRTGSKGLKLAEEELGGGATQRISEAQDEAFTQAAGREAGMNTPRLSQPAFREAYREVDNTFTDLANRTHLPLDQQLQNDLLDIVTRQQQAGIVASGPEDAMNLIAQLAGQNGGVLTGTAYRNITTQLRQLAETNPALSGTIREMRQALDSNIERNIDPALRTAWREARTRYANLMVMQDAATKAGADTAEGLIKPHQLRSAVDENVSDRHILSGDSRLGNLARAGSNVMAPLANSNTAARQRVQALGATVLALMGGAAGGGTANVPGALKGAAIGMAAGVAAPLVVGRALMSRPVQAYLSNQVMPSRGLDTAQKAVITLMNNNPRIREYLVKLLEGNDVP